MAHTPDRVHNPSMPCSCFVEFSGKSHSIRYCPLHLSAGMMLTALVEIQNKATEPITIIQNRNERLQQKINDIYYMAKQSIARAEGR